MDKETLLAIKSEKFYPCVSINQGRSLCFLVPNATFQSADPTKQCKLNISKHACSLEQLCAGSIYNKSKSNGKQAMDKSTFLAMI